MNRLTWRGVSRPIRLFARQRGARSRIQYGRLREVATALDAIDKRPNVSTD
jgi:hypothetical protein